MEEHSDHPSGNVTTRDVTGSGIFIGTDIATGNITIGDTIIGINKSLEKNPESEYLKGLKELAEKLEQEYQKYPVSDDKKNEINKSLVSLQNEVKDLKAGQKMDDLSPPQQDKIKSETSTLIDKILDALPPAAELVAKFTPLAPFDKLIRGGVQQIVDGIKGWRKSKH